MQEILPSSLIHMRFLKRELAMGPALKFRTFPSLTQRTRKSYQRSLSGLVRLKMLIVRMRPLFEPRHRQGRCSQQKQAEVANSSEEVSIRPQKRTFRLVVSSVNLCSGWQKRTQPCSERSKLRIDSWQSHPLKYFPKMLRRITFSSVFTSTSLFLTSILYILPRYLKSQTFSKPSQLSSMQHTSLPYLFPIIMNCSYRPIALLPIYLYTDFAFFPHLTTEKPLAFLSSTKLSEAINYGSSFRIYVFFQKRTGRVDCFAEQESSISETVPLDIIYTRCPAKQNCQAFKALSQQ